MLIAVPDAREHLEETAQSLAFGRRAMRVKNAPVVNEDLKATHVELLAQLDSRDAASFEMQEEMCKLQAEFADIQQTLSVSSSKKRKRRNKDTKQIHVEQNSHNNTFHRLSGSALPTPPGTARSSSLSLSQQRGGRSTQRPAHRCWKTQSSR